MNMNLNPACALLAFVWLSTTACQTRNTPVQTPAAPAQPERQFLLTMLEHRTLDSEIRQVCAEKASRQELREFCAKMAPRQQQEEKTLREWLSTWHSMREQPPASREVLRERQQSLQRLLAPGDDYERRMGECAGSSRHLPASLRAAAADFRALAHRVAHPLVFLALGCTGLASIGADPANLAGEARLARHERDAGST